MSETDPQAVKKEKWKKGTRETETERANMR